MALHYLIFFFYLIHYFYFSSSDGVGMSHEELKNMLMFGQSNKKDNNDKIGKFGFGFKVSLFVCFIN